VAQYAGKLWKLGEKQLGGFGTVKGR
jgi:hypothetical protein